MPTPITHIVLTEKIFNKYFKNENKKDFFIGTSFPDIRYFIKIERKKTHFVNNKISDLKKESSFRTGLDFHSLVDDIWNKFTFLNYPKLDPLLNINTIDITSFKFLGDELLYNRIDNWEEFIELMNNILLEEFPFDIKEKDLKKWHKILQNYFSKKPNNNTREKFMKETGFSKKRVDEINKNIEEIRSDHRAIQIIENIYNNFETLLKEHEYTCR